MDRNKVNNGENEEGDESSSGNGYTDQFELWGGNKDQDFFQHNFSKDQDFFQLDLHITDQK